MNASQYIVSIDLGTSGLKVSVVADNGNIAANAVRTVETLDLGDGASEQNPAEIWSAIVSAVRQVIYEADVPKETILAVTCASQYFSVVPIDERGHPISNMIPWMDARGGIRTIEMYQQHPETPRVWLERNGMIPLPTGNDSLSHMLFLKHDRPEVYKRAHKLVEPMDYITTRLTGVCTANPCTAFGQLLTDSRDLSNVHYDDEMLDISGIEEEKLPELVPVNSCIGTLAKDVADELGLSVSTKVFSGINDTQAVSIGTGIYRGEHGGLNIGTTCQVLAYLDTMRSDLEHGFPSMPSPIPDRYMLMAECGLGAKVMEHFLRKVVFAKDELADHASEDPFAGFEKTLASVPSGSDGLLYLPWLGGAQSPRVNSAMRGGFLNYSLDTTRAHMFRAVVEGVSLQMRWGLNAVEEFTEQNFPVLRFAGGGAVSDEWSQTLADVMGRPVEQLAEARYVNNRATAFLGFEQLGLLSLDDVERLCPIARVYEPQPESQKVLEERFEQFLLAYEQTRPFFEAQNV